MKRTAIFWVGLGLLCAACNKPAPRLNAPPHGPPGEAHDLRLTFANMADNALLADMSIADMHFIPHRPQLTMLGKDRLNRLAALMEIHGGTVRFNTSLTDRALIDKRIDVVTDYLSDAGIDTTAEVLVQDHRGGRGMDAIESILIKINEATYDPEAKDEDGG